MDERDKELMSQQSNDFLTRIGLDSDPFPAEADPSFYYENPDLMQRLDMIQHLIGFSNQMIFVTGEAGVGKTSMLDRLEYYAPDHWRICRIQANPMLNTPVLLRQLTSGFDIDIDTDTDDMFQIYSDALQSHIETLERAMLTPVVLIDNAHELPIDAFTMLFGFMQQEGGHSRMKMALFCEPQITRMLESPQLKTLAHNLTHQLEIPAFDEKQTGEYLEQRLHHAGLSGDFPFSPEAIIKIHRESDGVAGKIHTFAQQLLLNEEPHAAEDVDIEVLDEPENFPVVDEILAFDDDEIDETNPLAAVKPKSEKEMPIGRKFHSWQIGAVVAVLALLAGVLWITSQFNESPGSSIAEEIPLDISPESNDDLAQGSSEAELSQPDGSLFEESTNASGTSVEEPEFDLTTLDPNIDKGIETIEESATETPLVEEPESVATEDATEPMTTIEAGEEVIDPLDDFVRAMENEQHQHGEGEGAHEHTEVTVKIDENGKPQIVEVEQQNVPISEFIQLKEVEQTIEEPAVVEQVVEATEELKSPVAEPVVKPEVSTPKPVAQTSQKPIIPGVKGEAWLRIQNNSEVVLQILGTHDQQALAKFLKGSDMGSDVAWFTTLHNGEPWYVIVKGPYKDRATATSSISSMPDAIKKRKPWPRTIASVKKAMDDVQ